jgi:hypothetical protein
MTSDEMLPRFSPLPSVAGIMSDRSASPVPAELLNEPSS